PKTPSWTSISRASSQPLMKPAQARMPSGLEVSYVISRSASAHSSTRSRVAAAAAATPVAAARTGGSSASAGQPGARLVAALLALGLAPLLRVLLRALERLLGLAQAVTDQARVELVDRERLVDEDERVGALHLEEALALREPDHLGLGPVEPQLGRVQDRQQRLVVGQDADAAHARARGHHLDLVVEDLALGGEDLDGERGPGHRQSFFAASTTSSIDPLRKNADSGRSSCLPSSTSRNERTVSPIGTYWPGVPVNCSATENGCDRKRSILRARCTSWRSSSDSSSMPRMAMMSCSSR